jgi:hypothetical protein
MKKPSGKFGAHREISFSSRVYKYLDEVLLRCIANQRKNSIANRMQLSLYYARWRTEVSQKTLCIFCRSITGHKLLTTRKKSLSLSLDYQQSLVSVPDPENWVSYVPELSKPSIFSPSVLLMVVFDDSLSSPLLLCGMQVRRLRR